MTDNSKKIAKLEGDLENLTALCRQAFSEGPTYGEWKRGDVTRQEYDGGKLNRAHAKDAIREIVGVA